MEKRESTTHNPQGMCEKLFKCFHINPSFRPLRRLSFDRKGPKASSTAANSATNTPPEKTKLSLSNTTTTTRVEEGQGREKASSSVVPGAVALEKRTKSINEKSQDYINRARTRMRTGSNAGRKGNE